MNSSTRRLYVALIAAALVAVACQSSEQDPDESFGSGDDISFAVPEGDAGTADPTADTTVSGDPGLIFGKDVSVPASGWNKPELGEPYSDPSYGTQITRVTSAGGDRFNRNTYSRRQAENADGSLFFSYHGSARYHVYEVGSNNLVADLDINPDSEPQWHPTEATVLRHITGSNSYVGSLTLQETDVVSGATRTIADLGDRLRDVMPSAMYLTDRAEGSPSEDGDRYAWMVYNEAEEPIGIVSYDLASDTVLGTVELDSASTIDWVSASPSGRYVVASSETGTFVYDADLSNKRLLTEALEHSDIGYDVDGNDAYVYIDFHAASATAGWLVSVDLESLVRTKIFDIYDNANSSVHVSMKNYDKPGWALVSTYSCKVDGAWTCDKVFAVELASNGRIVNLAHTYNCGDQYWTETHAVVNRDFSRVYFNSDSGSCGTDAEVFRIDVPEFS